MHVCVFFFFSFWSELLTNQSARLTLRLHGTQLPCQQHPPLSTSVGKMTCICRTVSTGLQEGPDDHFYSEVKKDLRSSYSALSSLKWMKGTPTIAALEGIIYLMVSRVCASGSFYILTVINNSNKKVSEMHVHYSSSFSSRSWFVSRL